MDNEIMTRQDVFSRNVIGCRSEVMLLRSISDVLKGKVAVQTKLHGLLLYGKPGSGKTLLGECFCADCERYVLRIKWETLTKSIIDEIYLLFEEARKAGPSVVFLDDIDKYRFSTEEWMIFQYILDKNANEDIFVFATATSPYQIMPSVIRPGRFDWVLETTGLQDSVFNHMTIEAELGESITRNEDLIQMVSDALAGETLATVAEVARVAKMYCTVRLSDTIERFDFKNAMLEVLWHIKRRSQQLSQICAYGGWREIGIGLVTEYLNAGTVRYAYYIANDDGEYGYVRVQKYHYRNGKTIHDEITAAMAGKAAIELATGNTAITVQNDIQIARELVTELMRQGEFGYEFTTDDWVYAPYGLQMKREAIIADVLNKHYNEARAILKENWESAKVLVHELVEYEMIFGEEIRAALQH